MTVLDAATDPKLSSFASVAPVSPRAARAASRQIRGAKALAVVDLLAALAALSAVLVLSNLDGMPHGVEDFLAVRVTLKNVLLLMGLMAVWSLVFRGFGLYHPPQPGRFGEAPRIVSATGTCAAAAIVFPASTETGTLLWHDILAIWGLGTLLLLLVRHGLRQTMRWRRTRARRRVVIVGTGALAMRVHEALRGDEGVTYEVVGFVDDESAVPASPRTAERIVGSVATLDRLLMRHAIDEVFVALPVKSRYLEIHQALRACERVGVRAKYRTDLFATQLAWPCHEPAAGHVITMQVAPSDYRLIVKRALDVIGAAVLLVLAAPIMLTAAIAIRLASPGPVLFAQERYGLNRRPFRMFKFRTMVVDAPALQQQLEDRNEADGPVFKISNDPRITPVGRFLRRTSIDELPQLFNVLRGDMSLVGPRPLPLRDVQRFTDAGDMRRCSMRPGLTCLWQVSGRNNLSFDEWMRLDLAYIDSWSLLLDLAILARTVPAVLRRTGAH